MVTTENYMGIMVTKIPVPCMEITMVVSTIMQVTDQLLEKLKDMEIMAVP